MQWFKGLPQAEISDTVVAKDIQGSDVAFVRTDNGIHAFINSCTHLDFPLDGCVAAQNQIECPWHRAVFEFPEGKALAGPCEKNLAMLNTKLEDDIVFVEMPDA